MKRRKLVIALILILAMLVQCITPLCIGVKAATGTEITLNENLYTAVKKSLIKEKQASFSYSDSRSTITIDSSEISKVTKLNLAEGEISDITGLSAFYALTCLDLSSNNLTVDSNLEELNSLNLEYLDLSSNQLTSIMMLTNINDIESGNFDISNQKVTYSEVIQLDENSSQYYTIELPDILLADKLIRGDDDGKFEASWFYDDDSEGEAKIVWSSMSASSTYDSLTAKVQVMSNGEQLSGLVAIRVEINDSDCKLDKTVMNLYYCIVPEGYTGILFKDKNLYEAVRDQLTGGQEENEDLGSYKDSKTTLYKNAYDKAMILVIDDDTLLNKIPSLILNNKQITDLTGLEAFIGLDTTLNLSYNYIDSIEKIIELAENKITAEEKLQSKYTDALNTLSEDRSILIGYEDELESLEEQLASEKSSSSPDADKIADLNSEISQCQKSIDTYTAKVLADIYRLYTIYNNVYLLTSILTSDTFVLSLSDIENSTNEEIQNYAIEIMNNIISLEKGEVLTNWEINVIKNGLEKSAGLSAVSTDTLEEYFEDYIKNTDDHTSTDYYKLLIVLKEADAVITAGNYCVYNRYYESASCTYTSTKNNAFDALIDRLETFGIQTYFAQCAKSEYGNFSSSCMCNGNSFKVSGNVEVLSGKLIANSDLISTLVKVPRLRYLYLSANNIASIDGIETLAELKVLDLYQNFLGTKGIDSVRWSDFKYLEELNLGYNQLTADQIECLEVTNSLVSLDLSRNLIEGVFDFDISSLPNLMYADFSYNQITDISKYITCYQFQAKDYGMDEYEFILSDYTPKVLFQYQTLEINVSAVSKTDNNYIEVSLPPIYSQAKKIDDTRTSFAIQSLTGSVSSDGSKATLYAPYTGSYADVVVIDGYNGYGQVSTKGIAYGTTCVIYYTVVEAGDDNEDVFVDNTSIDTTLLEVVKDSAEFEFTLIGKDVDTRNLTFEWSLTGNTSSNTTITPEGNPATTGNTKMVQRAILNIGEDEEAEIITVNVKVYEDGEYSKTESITVRIAHDDDIFMEVVPDVTWTTYDDKDSYISVAAGEDQPIEFIIYDYGDDIDGVVASWEISGNTSDNTYITENGIESEDGNLIAKSILHVGDDEDGDELVITVTLNDGTTRTILFTKTENNTTTDTEDPVESDDENTDEDEDIDTDDTTSGDTEDASYSYDVDLTKGLVYVNVPGTSVSTFEKNLVKTSGYTASLKSNSQNAYSSSVIATSAVVVIYDSNGNEVTELEVVVLGDVNGDGKVNALDSGLIRESIDGDAYISGIAFKEAADVDRSGAIDDGDAALVLEYRAKIISSF